MQLCNRGGSNELPSLHVAVPVHIANVSAPSVFQPPLEDLILLVWSYLTEDQSPGPAHRGMPGWIRTVGSKYRLFVRSADRLPIAHEWPASLVMVLGFVGGKSGVGE